MQIALQFRDFAKQLINKEPPTLLQLSDNPALLKLQKYLMQDTTTANTYQNLQQRVKLQNLRSQKHLFSLGNNKEQLQLKLKEFKTEISQQLPSDNVLDQQIELCTANYYSSCNQNILQPVVDYVGPLQLVDTEIQQYNPFVVSSYVKSSKTSEYVKIQQNELQENLQHVYQYLAGLMMQNQKLRALLDNEATVSQQRPDLFVKAHIKGLEVSNNYLRQIFNEIAHNSYNSQFEKLQKMIEQRKEQFNQVQLFIKQAYSQQIAQQQKILFFASEMKTGRFFGDLRLTISLLQSDVNQFLSELYLIFREPLKIDFKGLDCLNRAVNDASFKPQSIFGFHDVASLANVAAEYFDKQNLSRLVGHNLLNGLEEILPVYKKIISQFQQKYSLENQQLSRVLLLKHRLDQQKLAEQEYAETQRLQKQLHNVVVSDKQQYIQQLYEQWARLNVVDLRGRLSVAKEVIESDL